MPSCCGKWAWKCEVKAGAIGIAAVVATAVTVILVRGNDRPAKLGEVVGCYAAGGERLSVGADGQLRFGDTSVRVTAHQDKVGLALNTEHGVYVDSFHKQHLTTADGALLLRVSDDQRRLLVPDFREQSETTTFDRVPC